MEPGLMVLSIYCAQMAPKWNSLLELRPSQRKDMSVQAYYDEFCIWKEKMKEQNYLADEQSYVDDFLYGLKWDLSVRVWSYELKPQKLSDAFYRARFEEAMIGMKAYLDKWNTSPNTVTSKPISLSDSEEMFKKVVDGQGDSENEALKMFDKSTEPIFTGSKSISGQCYPFSTIAEVDFSFPKAGIQLVEKAEQSFPSKLEFVEPAYEMFDEMTDLVPTARHSFSLVSLFRNERNDNSLLNKADNRMLDEVGQPFWLKMQGIKADQQLFDKMPELTSAEQNKSVVANEELILPIVVFPRDLSFGPEVTKVSSFNFSSKSNLEEEFMFVDLKNHVFGADCWVDGILMFTFDPGGGFSPQVDSDVLKNDNELVKMGRETNGNNKGNFIAIVEMSVNKNIVREVLENAFTYEENLIGANGYLEYELLVDAQLDCILLFHFVEIVINWRTSNVGSVDKVGKEWPGMALWYWSGNYLQAPIVYYLKIIVVGDHCVTPSNSAIIFLLEIPISGIPMVGLVIWQTNEVECLRKSWLAWLWIERVVSLLFDLSHVYYLVICLGLHILKYIGRTSSVDETKRGVHFASAVAVIIFMEPKPRRGHVDQIISICCILLKSFVDTKYRIPYILEDKDAFERVGKDIVRMDTTLGIIGLLTFQASDSGCISLVGGKSFDSIVNEKLSFSYLKHEEGGKGSSSNMLARVLPSYSKQENIPILYQKQENRKMTCIKRAVKVKVIADANFVMCWCAILNHDILPHIAIKIRYELATEIISIAGDDWKLETELGWGISQKVIGKEQSSLGDFRHGDSEMGSTLNTIVILLISNHHMFIGIDVMRFKRFDDDSGLHFAVKDLINEDMKPSPLLGPNVMNSLLVALEYASCCLPNGLRDTAGASPLPKALDDIGLILKTLLFSTAELEHYIWDPGSFVSVSQLLGQLLEGSWSCLGFSFHHLEDKAVVEGKDLSCPEV